MRAFITAAWREADWDNKNWSVLPWVAFVGVMPLVLVISTLALSMFSCLYHDPDWILTICLGTIGVVCAVFGTPR
jgi:hypothetical protein